MLYSALHVQFAFPIGSVMLATVWIVYIKASFVNKCTYCGIPPRKPRPGPARGLVLDGVYRRHPPDGDREQPFRLPNQRDWGTL
jgi:hypothetical protein